MHARILTLAALVGASSVLFACHKELSTPPIEEIVPLQVGNQWNYRVYRYNRQGVAYDSSAVITHTILRDTLIDRSTWYILNTGLIVQNTTQGYAYYNVAGKEAVLIYPGASQGSVGYGYQYPNYLLNVYTVPNPQAAPVPNSRQKFVGYQYSLQYTYTYPNLGTTQTQKREDWVVPAVGPVRWDTYYLDSDVRQQRLELLSYTLK